MKKKVQMFEYLDTLRESGTTNMFGAAPYLAGVFGLGKDEARDVLSAWIKTFDGKSSAADRAKEVA